MWPLLMFLSPLSFPGFPEVTQMAEWALHPGRPTHPPSAASPESTLPGTEPPAPPQSPPAELSLRWAVGRARFPYNWPLRGLPRPILSCQLKAHGGTRPCPPWLGGPAGTPPPLPACPLDLEATWSQPRSLVRFKMTPAPGRAGGTTSTCGASSGTRLGLHPRTPRLGGRGAHRARKEHRTEPGRGQRVQEPSCPASAAHPGAGCPALPWGLQTHQRQVALWL